MTRFIKCSVVCPANLKQVWRAWTTADGIRSFFAPDCDIELKVGGRYEIYFNPSAKTGSRGAEGTRILGIQPCKMLSFTWNSPPHLKEVRWQYTHVTVRFEAVDAHHTKVTLVNDGYGEGGQWEESLAYFKRAWCQVVLPRLKNSFSSGPLDWDAIT
ncbi:MAG: SRPBCC domain-containing protein [FCB group bacterium]|nr:SRPBCC domain-containing protein [FCB group bacterium]